MTSAVQSVTRWWSAAPWRRSAGLALLAALVGFALAGPWLSGHDPLTQRLDQVLATPDRKHWLGTDFLGRDLMARLSAALRLSIGLALLSVVLAASTGTLMGVLAAWKGGWSDRFLTAMADAVMALPGLLLVLLVAAFAPGEFLPLYLGLSVALWVEYFRITRAMARTLLSSPQVEASMLLGFGPGYIVRRHLLPELMPVQTTMVIYGMAGAVLALAALGFVGVGLQPPTAELGLMMIQSLPYYQEAPWLMGAPVAMLIALLLALVLIAPERRS